VNLTVLPLLVVALLMAAADPDVESVEVVMAGTHTLVADEHTPVAGDGPVDPGNGTVAPDEATALVAPGAVVVADADATVPVGARVAGPVYVVGGVLDVAGTITGDVVQLAGTVRLRPGATVAGELRHVGGTEEVASGADVGARTALPVTGLQADPTTQFVTWLAATLLLAGIGAVLGRRRRRALDNVARATTEHPVITVTVGLLLALTVVAVFVLMAFTLILLPVVAIGLVATIAVVAFGIIALGHAVASRARVDGRWATPLGVVVVMAALQVLGLVPVVGDLAALAVVLAGLGAVLVTSFGLRHFHPDVLPD
jgi:hypothetical protein